MRRSERIRVRWIIFFFQAEDGIRDDLVTGVQTCALPILEHIMHHLTDNIPKPMKAYPHQDEIHNLKIC